GAVPPRKEDRVMKTAMAGVLVLAFAGLASAQDQIPTEQAQKAARLVTEEAGKIKDLQIKTEVDVDKPSGVRAGGHAALIIPDKKLSEEAVKKAGKEGAPVGQLWLLKLAPVVKDKVAATDKLRLVTITHDGQDHQVGLFLLGVRPAG